MQSSVRQIAADRRWLSWLVVAALIGLAAFAGLRANERWLVLLIGGLGAIVLLWRPVLGLPVIVLASLLARQGFGTGTQVALNLATLLIPATAAVWLLSGIRERRFTFAQSRANLPLFLFLLAGLLSLMIGTVTWDSFVPKPAGFELVQLAQWAIFAFAAGAFWLTANLIKDVAWLKRLSLVFLIVGGVLAVMMVVPATMSTASSLGTLALIRPPFWILLAGVAGGQLLYDRELRAAPRIGLIAILAAAIIYSFVHQRESASNWVGMAVVILALIWLRFPRMRLTLIAVTVTLLAIGVLFPAVWEFAGGDAEWRLSGGSRQVLQLRVIDETMRNPVTGLGPAAYRAYSATRPLTYGSANWMTPQISSHNNYVDLFSHVGIVGTALFLWFVFEMARTGVSLAKRYSWGFEAGYVNGILAAGAASLVIMALADWILPFVYNIGFPGFQASLLVWLFIGGLVALENLTQDEPADAAD